MHESDLLGSIDMRDCDGSGAGMPRNSGRVLIALDESGQALGCDGDRFEARQGQQFLTRQNAVQAGRSAYTAARTQRLMRALFDSLLCNCQVEDLKVRLGWPATDDLEAPFQDWFGVSLRTVSRLGHDAF